MLNYYVKKFIRSFLLLIGFNGFYCFFEGILRILALICSDFFYLELKNTKSHKLTYPS